MIYDMSKYTNKLLVPHISQDSCFSTNPKSGYD